jgi:hypothetical protein
MLQKILQFFRNPSRQELVAHELDQAHRELLEACTARDYYAALVQYNITRIKRLENEPSTPAH